MEPEKNKTEYQKLLEDSRWKERRAKFLWYHPNCHRCRATATQVHHQRYEFGRMPWDYDDCDLEALCASCHKKEHEEKELVDLTAVRMPEEFQSDDGGELVFYDESKKQLVTFFRRPRGAFEQ
jgi:5-methylcytosine-specific restriction endonuclease McrA